MLLAALALSCQREERAVQSAYVTPLWPAVAAGRWGFVDAAGKVAIPCSYRAVEQFAEGRAAVFTDTTWGFIDTTGAMILPPRFHRVNPFANGRARVQTVENPYGFCFIDRKGNIMIPVDTNRQEERDFASSRAAIKTAGKYGYLDPFGRVVIPAQLSAGGKFHDGLAPARLEDRWGLIDTTGTWVVAAQYSWIESPREGVARAQIAESGKPIWCLVDAHGQLVARLAGFSEVGPMAQGRARVKRDNKWGYVDAQGKLVIEPRYAGALSFSEGLAAVQEGPDGTWAYIDRKGKTVIPATFGMADQFRGALAAVQQADRWGYVDKTGKYIWQSGKGELSLPPGLGEEK